VEHYILTLTCQDGPGIIHAVSGALLTIATTGWTVYAAKKVAK